MGIRDSSSTEVLLSLMGIILMMCLNWSLEALKWQFLVRKSERIGFFGALKGVLAGITVSSFTPNRIGEYFGRVFILKQTNPWKGAFMTITGSMSQLVVTVVLGMFAFIRFAYAYFPWQEYFSESVFWFLAALLILVVILSLLLYFNIRIMEPVLRRFTLRRWTSLREQLKVFGEYSKKELLIVLALSFARYMVFSVQYYLLLKMFMLPLGFFDGMMIIACVYVCMAAVPTVALSELGVRGSLAIFFTGLFFADNFILADLASFSAMAASTVIWIINLVIPALVGGVFVLQLKFFKK
jgi:MFS family permease